MNNSNGVEGGVFTKKKTGNVKKKLTKQFK